MHLDLDLVTVDTSENMHEEMQPGTVTDTFMRCATQK